MSDLKTAVLAAAVSKRLKEMLAEADAAGRADTLNQLKAAKAAMGLKSVDITLPGGTKIGTATLPQSKPGVRVDEDAFVKWVLAEHPTEIVQAVRDSFRKAVLGRLKVVGDEVIDTHGGEPVPWASVRPAAAEPTSFSITWVDDGRDAVEEAWRSGELAALLPGLLAIEGGE